MKSILKKNGKIFKNQFISSVVDPKRKMFYVLGVDFYYFIFYSITKEINY